MFRGTLVAQAITVFIGIYLAKLYGENAYGYFGFFISITSISSVIGTLQLENCIVTAKSKEESRYWFRFLSFSIPIVLTLVFLLLISFSIIIEIEKLSSTILILAFIGSLLITYNLKHQNLYTFDKRFLILSNTKIFIAFFTVLFQYLFYTYFPIFGLIYGFCIAHSAILIYNFYQHKNSLGKVDFTTIKKNIQTNTNIVGYLLPSNIVNSLANNLMPILILFFFGVEKAGVYFFSIKILATPLFLISSSISQVYFKESIELKNNKDGSLFKITKKIVALNLVLMSCFLLFINTIGISILEYFFENQWVNLRSFILILSFLIIARSTFNPISSLIVVLDKNKTGLFFNCYLFATNCIAIYFGTFFKDILVTVILVSLFGGTGYLVLLRYFFTQLKNNT